MDQRKSPTSPVTVAVVSWNTKKLLDRCLASLEPAQRAGLAEVLVIDNDSQDGSAALVRDRHAWAHLVASGENLGYGRAINLAAATTDAPWLAIANADVALRPDALEALLAAGESDPEAGILAPRLIRPDGTTQHSVWAFPTVSATILQNLRRMGRPRTATVGVINFAGSAARYLRLAMRADSRNREQLTARGRWTCVHLYALAPGRTLARYR